MSPADPTSAPPTPNTPPAALSGSLTLGIASDQRTLQATYTPPVGPPDAPRAPLPESLVRERIRAEGHGALFLNEPALQKLVQMSAAAREPFTLALGERRDARCSVLLARDKLSASLTLSPPQGGAALTLEQVHQALAEKGVKAGILDEVLARVVASGSADEVMVARGQVAVNGEHTRFEQLVPDMAERHPHIDEHDMTDYRDLGDLVVVKAGTPLLRRVPPTPGEDGFDVTGTVLKPKPGTSWPFAPGLKGVETAPGDPDLLVASVTGQPVMVSRGVKVEPNIVLQQVDLSTGNVKFDGTIHIKGDVKDGMKVTSTGDVFVGGAVEAAEIEAGGNVAIKGGVIGHSDYSGDSTRNSWFSAKVIAKGTINARYAENACLEAEVDVMLEDYAMHCEITALNHVVVGKPGSRKGRCIGGHTRATIAIRVAEAGSSAGMATLLQAGYNPQIEQQIAQLGQALEKHQAEVDSLQKIIDYLQANPERDPSGLLGRATLTQEMHQGQALELQEEIDNLNAALRLADGAQIQVELKVHSGTEVRMGGKVWRTAEDRRQGTFRIDDNGELVLA